MSRFLHFPVLLRIYLLSLVAGLPLAKAVEPPPTLPLLVQLEGQALVPFFLEQKQPASTTLPSAKRFNAKSAASPQSRTPWPSGSRPMVPG